MILRTIFGVGSCFSYRTIQTKREEKYGETTILIVVQAFKIADFTVNGRGHHAWFAGSKALNNTRYRAFSLPALLEHGLQASQGRRCVDQLRSFAVSLGPELDRGHRRPVSA